MPTKKETFENKPELREKMRLQRLNQVFPINDSSIEVKLQNGLKNLGIKFEKHKAIFGQPDIFIEPNICIFADGCYWHNCPVCFDRNELNGFQRKRQFIDIAVTQKLINDGHVVLRFWEHDINENFENKVLNKILSKIKQEVIIFG